MALVAGNYGGRKNDTDVAAAADDDDDEGTHGSRRVHVHFSRNARNAAFRSRKSRPCALLRRQCHALNGGARADERRDLDDTRFGCDSELNAYAAARADPDWLS